MRRSIGRIYGYSKKRILIILFPGLSVFGFNLYGQGICVDYHKQFCISYSDKGYQSNNISRSFFLPKDTTVSINLVVYNGMDYHISISADDVFGGKAIFKIAENDKIIYNNINDNNNLNVEFTIVKQSEVKLILSTPESTQKCPGPRKIMGCLGVLIESKPSEPTGF